MTIPLADQLFSYISIRFPGEITNFVFLDSGFEREIYSFGLRQSNNSQKNYIVRLFPGDGASEKLMREARGLSLLQKACYPTPELLLQETDPTPLGMPFEIMEKLEGQVLWPFLATVEPDEQKQLLSRFGLLLVQLHTLDWQRFIDDPDQYQNNPTLILDESISEYRSLYAAYNLSGFLQIVEWLNKHKHEISVQPAVVHRDFHANNIFLCPGNQLFVIDWTQFGISDYRVDLSWTLLIMGDLGNKNWGKQIFNAYASSFHGQIEDIEYFNVIAYMKLLGSTFISNTFDPKELGLRSERMEITKKQLSVYKQLSQRLQNITQITIPELDSLLDSHQ